MPDTICRSSPVPILIDNPTEDITMTQVTSKNWLITGVSSGLGRTLAEAALAQGDRVVGTVRKITDVASFEALAPGRAMAVVLDVTRTLKRIPSFPAPDTRSSPRWPLLASARPS
jgi:hypothetical protein